MPKKQKKVNAQSVIQEAKAECVMELNSKRILYASQDEVRLPMASTTKILTAITVLETCIDIQSQVVIPKEAAGIEGSSVYLKEGDVYTVEELLYGLMLRSGNDCASALALHSSQTIENFAASMNKTAQKAGALYSNFKNPHGLPCEGHYTTARDLSYITCFALQNPIFKEIVSTRYYTPCHWQNKNKMLSLYDGALGVKTGYTKEAGRCLVSAAEKEGMTLICTVLNCPTTYERSIQLLDDAFNGYKNVKILSTDTPIAINGEKEFGYVKKDYFYPLLTEEIPLIKIKTFPIKKHFKLKNTEEIIGQFEIYLAKQLLFSGNLYKL